MYESDPEPEPEPEIENLFDNPEDEPNGEERAEDGQDPGADDDDEGDGSQAKVVKPKVVRKARPKLDATRLTGPRGLPILKDEFKDFKFKGKGHEKEDLTNVLNTLTLWTHRLFPPLTFDDALNRIEKLGVKRPVRTCLQRIRTDMPVLDEDFVENVEDRNDSPDQQGQNDDPFDQLIAGNDVTSRADSPVRPALVIQSITALTLTAEQLERITRNRKLAEERRAARLARIADESIAQDDLVTNTPVSSEHMDVTAQSQESIPPGEDQMATGLENGKTNMQQQNGDPDSSDHEMVIFEDEDPVDDDTMKAMLNEEDNKFE